MNVQLIEPLTEWKRPRKRPRPIKCPQSVPLLNILGATPGVQMLRFADSSRPDSSAKPFGAIAVQLFLAITDREVGSIDEARLCQMVTRNPFRVAFSNADDGQMATYYARWVSARGETGPWSVPVCMTICA